MTRPALTRRAALGGLAAGAVLPAIPAAAKLAKAAAAPATPAAALLDRVAWRLIELSPGTATSLGVDTGIHAALRGRLGDDSPASEAARRAMLKQSLAEVAALPKAGLDASTQTSLAVVDSAFRTALDGMALPYGVATTGGWRNTPYAVIQNVGAWLDLPQTFDGTQPVKTRADVDYYLARLAAAPRVLDAETAKCRDARLKGLVPPAFLLDRTIAGLEQTIAAAPRRDGPWIAPLLRKAAEAKLAGFDADAEYARAQRIVAAGVIPALQRQLAEIRAERALAKSDAGLAARPHGEEWYAWGLRASTTTRRTAADLHAMGLAQLADLTARMDTILRGFGLTEGSVGARATALQARPGMGFADSDDGRKQIVATMPAKIDAIRPQLPRAFRRLVTGDLEIRRLPLAQEPGAPAAFGGPGSRDGKVPGKIWVNLGDVSIHNKVTIPDLVYHEGVPGHVWQGEYTHQLPMIRSILAFNAYSEGWALYAEGLADELGLYDDDPAGRLGYLMGLAWRAVRLVVDTGIHAQGWSRAKAVETFMAATGLPEATARAEVDRYCAWPGQACGYKVGETEIRAQRARAQAALGPRYDLRDFDQAVVDGGNVPLDVLAQNVGRYIAAAKG